MIFNLGLTALCEKGILNFSFYFQDSPTITTASPDGRRRTGISTTHQEYWNEGEEQETEYRAEEDHAAAYIAQ